MTLSSYHQKYFSHSDKEIYKRVAAKEEELRTIFSQVPLNTDSDEIAVAVLGCADKRFIRLRRDIFSRVLGKPIKLATFDITIEHLQYEDG